MSPIEEPPGSDELDIVGGAPTQIANEFADVTIRLVYTRNGARLEIAAPRRGTVIQLCPLELEALAGQSKSALSALLGLPTADAEGFG